MENASYVTGFVDGEGCFSISFSLRKKMKYGIEVRPSFSVSQHKRNKEIVEFFQKYFSCGSVRFLKRDQNYKFEVRSIKDLVQKIIPHFKQCPLKTSKREDFEKFSQVCELIDSNHHLNQSGLIKIIVLATSMNEAGQRRISKKELLRKVNKMNA